jgi:hypothetical protein
MMEASDHGGLDDPAVVKVLHRSWLRDLDAQLLELPCVQSNADVFSGGSPAGARASSPVAWMAGQRETDALEPIDKALGRRVSESPGRNESERSGSPETEEPRRPSGWELREGSRTRRTLAGATVPSGGVGAAAR